MTYVCSLKKKSYLSIEKKKTQKNYGFIDIFSSRVHVRFFPHHFDSLKFSKNEIREKKSVKQNRVIKKTCQKRWHENVKKWKKK